MTITPKRTSILKQKSESKRMKLAEKVKKCTRVLSSLICQLEELENVKED